MDETAYIEALMLDLDQELERTGRRELISIFIGGGTPSLFSAAAIDDILCGIHSRATFIEDIEITLEANPGTFEQQKFTDFHAAGINRLSIGIQSFDNSKLKALGRIHDQTEAMKAVDMARKAGFENINLDLMFGLPDQSIEQAVTDMQTACDINPTHISHYQLTIEPNTYFHKHRPLLSDDDSRWEMQQVCHELLHSHGYAQYEVSAFAQPGRHCRHNINYWQFGDYVGIGAGAHGKITDLSGRQITRRWKHRQPLAYIGQALEGNACSGTSTLDQADILFEFMMNALRLRDGFDFELFEHRTGLEKERLVKACSNIDQELLEITEHSMKTSPRGFDFLNEVLERLIK